MINSLLCRSPIDQSVIAERAYAQPEQTRSAIARAQQSQIAWRAMSLSKRQSLVNQFVDAVLANKMTFADEITLQMGRPRRYTENEVNGFGARAKHMIQIADKALADIVPEPIAGFTRFMRREPLGVVFIIAPWNYPMLTTVNALVPALLAGNSVILKHSAQTPLIAERLVQCAQNILPDGVFQYLHLQHQDTLAILADHNINGVFFTGSVAGGVAVEKACAGRFLHVGLELGGCDPAYVREDADIAHAVESVIDGALFNSGQSCCGIQRIYVHKSLMQEFVSRSTALIKSYSLGDPRHHETTLGPLVRASTADESRAAIAQALAAGAQELVEPHTFALEQHGSAYMAPRVLAYCNESMPLMREEFFAPVAGIQMVESDEQAIGLMNDSAYGLTAAIYTRTQSAALAIGGQLETGTVFMNRCDVLDPALAWTGVKNTGRGATLSSVGFEHLTRIKSFHFKTE